MPNLACAHISAVVGGGQGDGASDVMRTREHRRLGRRRAAEASQTK